LHTQLVVADHLGVTLEVVRSMSFDEFLLWVEWLKMQKEAQSKASKRRGGMR